MQTYDTYMPILNTNTYYIKYKFYNLRFWTEW